MSEADDVVALVAAARPLLFAGQPLETQGAVLADLVADWLADYVVRGDHKATDRLRKDVLALHVETVRRLVPLHAKAPAATPAKVDA
jgi:hypothetical protein